MTSSGLFGASPLAEGIDGSKLCCRVWPEEEKEEEKVNECAPLLRGDDTAKIQDTLKMIYAAGHPERVDTL